MSTVNSARGKFAPQLRETMTGSPILIGTLLHTPVHLILNSLSDVEIDLIIDDEIICTFEPHQAIVLDMRANHGFAQDFTIDKGTSFYGDGASGDFCIAYTYAREV